MEVIHVLAIDDDPLMRTLLSETLHRAPFEVRMASTGEQGIEIATQQPTDIILLDMKLPGIDGPEVLQILRNNQKTKDIPIVFLSGELEPERLVAALEFDPDDYISKVVSSKELIARVKWAVRRHQRLSKQKL